MLFRGALCFGGRYNTGIISYRSYSTIEEKWKSIPDYPNYEASTLGRIRNIKTNRLLFINYDRFRAQNLRPRITITDSQGQTRNVYVNGSYIA